MQIGVVVRWTLLVLLAVMAGGCAGKYPAKRYVGQTYRLKEDCYLISEQADGFAKVRLTLTADSSFFRWPNSVSDRYWQEFHQSVAAGTTRIVALLPQGTLVTIVDAKEKWYSCEDLCPPYLIGALSDGSGTTFTIGSTFFYYQRDDCIDAEAYCRPAAQYLERVVPQEPDSDSSDGARRLP